MGLDLTTQYVDETYQKLIQLSGSNQITDGTGSLVTDLDINASTATSASYATTASYAENANVDSGSWDGQYSGSNVSITAPFTSINGDTYINGIPGNQFALRVNTDTGSLSAVQAFVGGQGATGYPIAYQANYAADTYEVGMAMQFDATDTGSVKPTLYFDSNGNGSMIVAEELFSLETLNGDAIEFKSPLSASAGITGSLLGTASYADRAAIADTATNTTNATYAQNTITTGKSLEASPILKGTPLYFTGSGTNGNLVGVYLADAGNPNRMPAGGVAAQDIDPGEEGIILLDGYIGGVSTSAFQSGDKVYVGIGGGYTNVAPTGSNNKIQFLGNVEKSHPSNGSGVINMMGEARALPNIQEGYLWVGDANDVAQAISTSSIAGDSFPYTGSAGISGSLAVVGPISSETFGTISLTGDNPGINRNILDFTGADFSVIRSDSGMIIDNTAGTGSVSVFTNGNMQFEPQGDLDFYTPAGNLNLTGNRGSITTQDTLNIISNTTQDFQGIFLQAPNVRINLSDTGSGAGDFALSAPGFGQDTPGMLLSLGTGSYGSNPTTATMLFTGDDAFFSAVGNFYIKNVYNDTGSITVWSESELELRGDTGVTISGDSFSNPNDPIEISIKGSTFMDSFTSGIMAFQPQIGTYTRVTQFQKAFVEDPLVINAQGTVEVQTGATLRVTQELGKTDLTNYIGDANITGTFIQNGGNFTVGGPGLTQTFNGFQTTFNAQTRFNNSCIVDGAFLQQASLATNIFDGDTNFGKDVQITGSLNIAQTMNLAPQDPLPAGAIGDLAVSGSNLFFYNGAWTQVI